MLEPKAWFAATILAAALIIAAAIAISLRWEIAVGAVLIFVAIGFLLGWRAAFAFLVAPLWVPVANAPYAVSMSPYPEQRHQVYFTIIIAAIFAYGGVLTLGMPAFLILRARKRPAFWIAPVVGFCAGVLTCSIFLILFSLSLGYSLTHAWHALAAQAADWSSPFFPTGGLGAVVGTTLWLIAGPDRERAA